MLLQPKISIIKVAVAILFILLPFIGFFLGIKYQESKTLTNPLSVETGLRPVSTITPITVDGQVPSSTWKTYTNEEYGFAFGYPDEYQLTEKQGSKIDLYSLLISLSAPRQPNISIEVVDSAELSHYVSVIKPKIVGHVTDKIENEESITVDQEAGIRLDYEVYNNEQYLEYSTVVVLQKDDYIIDIASSSEEIDHILSTFKFLDNESSATNN